MKVHSYFDSMEKIYYLFMLFQIRCQYLFSFQLLCLVCELFGKGIVALFAPSLSPSTLNHIRSTSTALSVPLMETGFEYLWTRPEYSINVSPHPWSIGTVRKKLSQFSRNVPEIDSFY